MKLLVQYGSYHCAKCRALVRFEPVPEGWDGSAIGACVNSRCPEFEKRFRTLLPTIDVEPLPN